MFDDIRETDSSDDDRAGVVLVFPSRPAPVSSAEHLARVVSVLQRALAEQEHALAEWRESLNDLGAALGGLQGSLTRYRSALEGLAIGVDALGSEARRLEAMPV